MKSKSDIAMRLENNEQALHHATEAQRIFEAVQVEFPEKQSACELALAHIHRSLGLCFQLDANNEQAEFHFQQEHQYLTALIDRHPHIALHVHRLANNSF